MSLLLLSSHHSIGWLDGGVVTQRIANPCTPVRFRLEPPTLLLDTIISFQTRKRCGFASIVRFWAAHCFDQMWPFELFERDEIDLQGTGLAEQPFVFRFSGDLVIKI